MKQMIARHRPKEHVGRGDKYLAPMAQELRRDIARIQRSLPHDTFCLQCPHLNELVAVLIEFGEDIHNSIGIWESLETYNQEFFGVRLPCTLRCAEPELQQGLSASRVQHLLWVLWLHFKPELIAGPDHPDLVALAKEMSGSLARLFESVPRDSGVKTFLAGSNRYGWEIKRKLLWFGRHSYLFRHFFGDYMSEQENDQGIGETDDFVCQVCTLWSGLGVIDILAQTLELGEEDRGTLRNWYERHTAPYLVLSFEERDHEVRTMQVENLVSEKKYTVRLNMSACPFQIGNIVVGGLVAWRAEWYWSGEQRRWDGLEDNAIRSLVKDMEEKSSAIAYRYRPDLAERAKECAMTLHEEFVLHCGDDLKHYPNGLSLAADMQKFYVRQYRKNPKNVVEKVMKRHGLSHPQPNMQFPAEFLDHDQGVGAFSNPDEGHEYMLSFDHVVSGMKKQSKDLTEDEQVSLRGFVESTAISPAFVHRVVRDHGHQAIGSAFMIGEFTDGDLQYFLRRYKGAFYRKRYAAVSFRD